MLPFPMKRKTGGFTLIEILIVAAMIALLAGIAAINIQAAYVQAQRKATFGECKNIATALGFAYMDIGIYPKLCFLSQNELFIAPPDPGFPNQPGTYLASGFEYIGHPLANNPSISNRVIQNWSQGMGSPGYFSAGGGRRGVFQGGRGGLVDVEIPMISGYTPQVIGGNGQLPIYRWPADPWGRPYVLYMLHQEGVTPNGLPVVRFCQSATENPNFALAVVSYGPNGIPGGPDIWTAGDVSTGQAFALFDRIGRQYPDQSDYRILQPSEYTQARAEAWSYERILGEDPDTPPGLSYIGVIDKGSDDIVIEFY
jgi:prepilin-type N-terminal cleavage/methylation domain-containing protein